MKTLDVPRFRAKRRHIKPLSERPDVVIIALIMSKEFILDFFGIGNIVNALLCVLIVLRLILYRWRMPLPAILSALITPTLFVAAIIMDGAVLIALKNVLRIAQLQVYALYILFLFREQRRSVIKMYNDSGTLFNAILIINSVAMLIQYHYPGIIQAASDGTPISFEDNISGFFGYGSTHAVGYYVVFVIIYNIGWCQRVQKNKKVLLALYTGLITIASLYIGSLNDNKALFFIMAIAAVIMCVYIGSHHIKAAAITAAIVIPLTIIVTTIAYITLPSFRAFVDKIAWSIDFVVVRAMSPDAIVNGSDERFKLVVYSLILPCSWLLGEGFGAADMYQPGFHGFNHFGQNDYGTIIILGGVWIYLALVASYTYTISSATDEKWPRKIIAVIPLVLYIVASTIYVQVFSQVRIGLPFLLLGIGLALIYNQQKSTFKR